MTPEQAADKIYAVTGVILGTDAARHIASYLSVMETRIAELEEALGGLTAWVAEWTDHVGDCSHKNETCTCGRAFNLHKARAALEGERDVNSD